MSRTWSTRLPSHLIIDLSESPKSLQNKVLKTAEWAVKDDSPLMFFVGFENQLNPEIGYAIALRYKDGKHASDYWIYIIPSSIFSQICSGFIYLINTKFI